MSEQQQRDQFFSRFEAGEVELVVVTGDRLGGAGRSPGRPLWVPSAQVVGYLDGGELVDTEARLEWLATDDQRDGWIHHLERFTQYRVRVRRAVPVPGGSLPPRMALLEVLERGLQLPELEQRLAQYRAPVAVECELGRFEVDRSLGWMSGTIDWLGTEVEVNLDLDDDCVEGAETVTGALAGLRRLAADAAGADSRWRTYIASELTGLANEWRENESGPALTEADVASRVSLESLEVGSDGSAAPMYDDGDLFAGHVIIVEVEPDGTLTDATIAG